MQSEIAVLKPFTPQLLLYEVGDTAVSIKDSLTARGVILFGPDQLSRGHANTMYPNPDIVLANVTQWAEEPSKAIQFLQSRISTGSPGTRLLCFSTMRRSPRFVLNLMEQGARYIRIADASMLLEAVELILAEASFESKRVPTFRIVHRFSQGTCAPGEEVAAVEFVRFGRTLQLRLALAERLSFNLLAEHGHIALDSAQIVSGLGDWFYRDHARNSGTRQIAKVRVATVKVIAQRIRRAMADVFDQEGVAFNPYDVLSSVRAEGSKRALYKLNAEVQWEHVLLQK